MGTSPTPGPTTAPTTSPTPSPTTTPTTTPTPGPSHAPTHIPTSQPTWFPTEATDRKACFDAVVTGTDYTNVLDSTLDATMDEMFDFEILMEFQSANRNLFNEEILVRYCLIVDGT